MTCKHTYTHLKVCKMRLGELIRQTQGESYQDNRERDTERARESERQRERETERDRERQREWR